MISETKVSQDSAVQTEVVEQQTGFAQKDRQQSGKTTGKTNPSHSFSVNTGDKPGEQTWIDM